MNLKKKSKKFLTSFIAFICVISLLLPSKLALAEVLTVPVITLLGDKTAYVEAGAIYRDPGANITDDKDANLSATITVTSGAEATGPVYSYEKGAYIVFYKEGIYKLQYNVTDSDGNVAVMARTVEVNTMDDKRLEGDDYYVDGYKTNLKFRLLSDEEVKKLLAVIAELPMSVEITRDEDTLISELKNADGSTYTTSAGATYKWYRDENPIDGENAGTYTISDADKGKDIKLVVTCGESKLISNIIKISSDETKLDIPSVVKIKREDNTLMAKLMNEDGSKFTTSAAVEYSWYRDEELLQQGVEDRYTISTSDKGSSIAVKVDQYNLQSAPFYIDKDESKPGDDGGVEVPSAISAVIKGTERVGKTLSGELIHEDGSKVTTSSAVTYEWYRLPSKNSKSSELVGDNKTYKLVSRDQGKYIKLSILCEGEIYEVITSKIAKKASSSSSSSSSNSNSSNNSNSNSNSSLSDNLNNTTKEQTPIQNNNQSSLADGWNYNSIEWKYMINGKVATGWNQINGVWYYMDPIGVMMTGWQKVNGSWYLLSSTGAMTTGWQQVNGIWYLLKNDGAMAAGWQQVNGIWYLLKNDGAMATGWCQIGGTWYLFNSDGSLVE